MLLLKYGSGYREEIVATAFVLILTVGGSFFLVHQVTNDPAQENKEEPAVLGSKSLDKEKTTDEKLKELEQLLTSPPPELLNKPSPTPMKFVDPIPTPNTEFLEESSASASPTPTVSPSEGVQIPFGSDQQFENNEYILSFTEPRLIVGDSKVFKVKGVLANKKVESGLDNKLFAEIVDAGGDVVAESAPMTISEIKVVKPGQKITFTASLSLFHDTEITKIKFEPGTDLLAVIYNL